MRQGGIICLGPEKSIVVVIVIVADVKQALLAFLSNALRREPRNHLLLHAERGVGLSDSTIHEDVRLAAPLVLGQQRGLALGEEDRDKVSQMGIKVVAIFLHA
jgi:hypothetical protein